MKKILVISDSHGEKEYVDFLIGKGVYDFVIFAGDGVRDFDAEVFMLPNFKIVKGNCDYFSDYPELELFEIMNKLFFVTHGHIFNVKKTMIPISEQAIDVGANVIVFGHTHEQFYDKVQDMYYINPGSLRYGDYAEIVMDNNKFVVDFKNIKEEI